VLIVATDTGGTFTDLTAYDVSTGGVVYTKSLTTYDNLARGVFECVEQAGVRLAEGRLFKHGTTLAINALIQRSGARTALLATQGFRDVLEMGRGNRPEPFDLYFRRHPPLVPRELRFELDERMSGTGEPLRAPSRAEVSVLAERLREAQVEAVAVSFLNSYLSPAHEEQVAAWLEEDLPDTFVTRGTALSREWYEFERTATVAANAYVGPQVAGYLDELDGRLSARRFPGKFFMMGSNGGVLGLRQAVAAPVSLVESGPVGGTIGAAAYARALGIGNAIAFDMGGTTAKCALVQDGRFDVKSAYYVGGYQRGFPIRGSVLDIVEVGAGGGSIAWLDDESQLHVGPRSAGSTPGPVAYGRGGIEPTVTDANLVLGRIRADGFLGGSMQLDLPAAHSALQERVAAPLGYSGADGVDRLADGIVAIACVTMAGAIKRITVEKGFDPRDFAMFAFGGGGPLHAFQIARQLHVPQVVVPPEPSNFSTLGMLLADLRIDEATTFLRPLDADALRAADGVFKALQAQVTDTLEAQSPGVATRFERYAEIRYRGQVHSVRTLLDGGETYAEIRAKFEAMYRARFGHADSKKPVEIVSLGMAGHGEMEKPRLAALAPNHDAASNPRADHRPVYFAEGGGRMDALVYKRGELPAGFEGRGPALIEEYGSTTVVGPNDRFEIGRLGEIRIQIALAQ